MGGDSDRTLFWTRRSLGYLAIGALGIPIAFFLHEGVLENAFPQDRFAIPAILATAIMLVAATIAVASRWPLPSGHPLRQGVATTGVGVLAGGLVFGSAFAGIAMASGLGHCDFTPSDAWWDEPGLYGSFPGPSDDRQAVVAHHVPDGLPFEDAALDAQSPGVTLLQVVHRPPTDDDQQHGDLSGTTLLADGTVRLSADDRWSDERIRATFTAFAHNVTDADDDQIADWADALFQNQSAGDLSIMVQDGDQWEERTYTDYMVHIDGPWRLEDLWASLDLSGDLDEYHSEDGWSFRFDTPEKSITLKRHDITLTVNTRDNVTVDGWYGEMNETAYLERLEGDFSPYVPLPSIHKAEVSGFIC